MPIIAYTISNSGNVGASKVLQYNGSNWITLGNTFASVNGSIYLTSMNNILYACYSDNNETQNVLYYSNGNWASVSGLNMQNTWNSKLINDNDTLYLSYNNSKINAILSKYGNPWENIGPPLIFTCQYCVNNGKVYAQYEDANFPILHIVQLQ